MDHTRASVLSVCTAAIIGAGASAGGLEEGAGAGGPADCLMFRSSSFFHSFLEGKCLCHSDSAEGYKAAE